MSEPAPSMRRPPIWLTFVLLLLAALVVRLAFFTGLGTGDDVTYMSQAIAHYFGNTWPPEQTHWSTRLGMTFATAGSIAVFGLAAWSLVLPALVIGALKVPVYWWIARRLGGETQALIVGLLIAVYPMEVLFSSHLFPDGIVGFFSTLAIYGFYLGLSKNSVAGYLMTGVCVTIAYFCRETVVFEAPIYLALWIRAGRVWRPRMLWALIVPVLALAGEYLLYHFTADNGLFRVDAILNQVHSKTDHESWKHAVGEGSFLLDPWLMVVGSHELGLFFVFAMPLAIYSLFAWPTQRIYAIWLLVGFGWLYYGTASPSEWLPVHRIPRYSGALTLPALMLIAHFAMRLRSSWRFALLALLVVSSLLSITLDRSNRVTAPHKVFAASPYAAEAAVEPAEYFTVRWAIGLEKAAAFDCADGVGRETTLRNLRHLPGTRVVDRNERRYLVFAPIRRKELLAELQEKGWKKVHVFPGKASFGRSLVASILDYIPTQQHRAKSLRTPGDLLVMERTQ